MPVVSTLATQNSTVTSGTLLSTARPVVAGPLGRI
jgi:hypothetical protein